MKKKHEAQIPSIVDVLRQSGENFELLTCQDTIKNTKWLENNFPTVSWGRINWEKVPESLCISYADDLELLSAFKKIVVEQCLEGNPIVSWSNGLTLPIRINMDVMKRYSKIIFQEDWETWICNEQDNWLIENYHDGEICFGKCIIT